MVRKYIVTFNKNKPYPIRHIVDFMFETDVIDMQKFQDWYYSKFNVCDGDDFVCFDTLNDAQVFEEYLKNSQVSCLENKYIKRR